MKDLLIPMQIGGELRIKKTGDVVVDNPEIELAQNRRAADAALSYHFDEATGEHVLRLLDPVADHKHLRKHRPDD
jgi:hypothetical protein